MADAAATMAKVRSHKYGRRRLATDSALARYNWCVRQNSKPGGKYNGRFTNMLASIANDQYVKARVANMNQTLVTVLPIFGVNNPEANIIKLNAPYEMAIPKSVWLGKLKLYGGTLTTADKATVHTAKLSIADQAGLLRRRIAQIMATSAIVNDLANTDFGPNAGGQAAGGL